MTQTTNSLHSQPFTSETISPLQSATNDKNSQRDGASVGLVGKQIPVGRWSDTIFHCHKNIWPSWGCLVLCGGCWMVAQIANKSGWTSFRNIMAPLLTIFIACYFISAYTKYKWVYAVPFGVVAILSIFLRLFLVKKYNITSYMALEAILGLVLWPLSILQMARHVYGYRYVFEGDANDETTDYYGKSVEV